MYIYILAENNWWFKFKNTVLQMNHIIKLKEWGIIEKLKEWESQSERALNVQRWSSLSNRINNDGIGL